MNEWLAFGIVAVICGLLAWLMSLSGDGASGDGGTSDRDGSERP